MNIKLQKVNNKRDLSHFVKFQRKLYKGNPYYVPPVDRGEIAFFDKSNPMVQSCDYALWLAYHNNHVVGRIAAIINTTYNSDQNKKQARFTHFDFIHNEHVAHLLLAEAQSWAKSKGMTEIIGPFGFTNLDKHGLLVEGFEELACQSSNYNHSYYQEYIESFGFEKLHDWVEHQVNIPKEIPSKIERMSNIIKDRYELKVVNIDSKKTLKEYAPRVFDLYNITYSQLYGVTPLNEKQKQAIINEFIPYVEHDMVAIIADKNDTIVGFGFTMFSYSKSLQKANGSLFPLGIYHLLRNKRNNKLLDLLLIGIHPDYRRKGVNALVFNEIAKVVPSYGLEQMETTQCLESNQPILNLWNSYDSRLHKRARLYIKRI